MKPFRTSFFTGDNTDFLKDFGLFKTLIGDKKLEIIFFKYLRLYKLKFSE